MTLPGSASRITGAVEDPQAADRLRLRSSIGGRRPAVFGCRAVDDQQASRSTPPGRSSRMRRLEPSGQLGTPAVRVPAGRSTISYRHVAGADAPRTRPDAPEPPEELPDALLPTPCPAAAASRRARPGSPNRFGSVAPGYGRVQAICDHGRPSDVAYGSSNAWTTAADVPVRLRRCTSPTSPYRSAAR